MRNFTVCLHSFNKPTYSFNKPTNVSINDIFMNNNFFKLNVEVWHCPIGLHICLQTGSSNQLHHQSVVIMCVWKILHIVSGKFHSTLTEDARQITA